MAIVFDPDKDLINVAKHGLSLSAFRGFDDAPVVKPDERLPYGEARYRAWGLIRGDAYCLAYTVREADIRLISFRRAHAKEMRRHG